VDSEVIYRGRLLNLRRDQVRLPDGSTAVREVVEHPGSVTILPLVDGDRVMLVRQYRYAVGEETWELPAGGVKPGESPEAAARRELEEETGHAAGELELLTFFYPTPGFCSERMWLYRAGGLTPVRRRPEADEDIRVETVSLARARAMVRQGLIRDAKTIIGVLLSQSPDGERRRNREALPDPE